MAQLAYGRWIHRWEESLARHATARKVQRFEWGLDWTVAWPFQHLVRNTHSPENGIGSWNRFAIDQSEEFFAYERPSDFKLDDGKLRFTSSVVTPHPENNVVHALWYPADKGDRAVVLVPHWNAQIHQYQVLARSIVKLGISVLRLSPPYHDYRMPFGQTRAEFAVSPNICRTIDATRQAVVDTRCCFDWLELQGYSRLGLVGISLGSCNGFIASAHDRRIVVNVFTHCGSSFPDIVWTGLSTRHVRQGLEAAIGLDTLREVWRVLSPANYLNLFSQRSKRSILIYSAYDTTVLPCYSRELIEAAGHLNVKLKTVALPCGHYTLGETPFKFMAGYQICSFLMKNL